MEIGERAKKILDRSSKITSEFTGLPIPNLMPAESKRKSTYAIYGPFGVMTLGAAIFFINSVFSGSFPTADKGISKANMDTWSIVGLIIITMGFFLYITVDKWYKGKEYLPDNLLGSKGKWDSERELMICVPVVLASIVAASLSVGSQLILGISPNIAIPIVLIVAGIAYGWMIIIVWRNAKSLPKEEVIDNLGDLKKVFETYIGNGKESEKRDKWVELQSIIFTIDEVKDVRELIKHYISSYPKEFQMAKLYELHKLLEELEPK
jgi:hypothetical protein